jgi:hypothetical protein
VINGTGARKLRDESRGRRRHRQCAHVCMRGPESTLTSATSLSVLNIDLQIEHDVYPDDLLVDDRTSSSYPL